MIPADKEEDSWLANQVWGADGGPWGPMVPASACEGWGRGPMDLLDLRRRGSSSSPRKTRRSRSVCSSSSTAFILAS